MMKEFFYTLQELLDFIQKSVEETEMTPDELVASWIIWFFGSVLGSSNQNVRTLEVSPYVAFKNKSNKILIEIEKC